MGISLNDPRLEALLDRLHAQSLAQESEIDAHLAKRAREGSLDTERPFDDALHRFFADKMVALERDKAELCYLLCRSLGASRVVEAGTSFGVSTLYLAAAVRDGGEGGVVIATEYEPRKAEIARGHFQEAGLDAYVELREGDLRETLQEIPGPVDFALIDIWEVALPALERVSPHLRRGAMVVTDNTTAFADMYRDYFRFVNDPRNRFMTQTLPFSGGLELSVRI
jgi:predicted O-methyltransferase YrrM